MIYPTFIITKSVCRQDGGDCPPSAPSMKFSALSLALTKLASLVKGRWIDGKAQTLLCCFLLAICPPFLYCKLFCRQDGGIASVAPNAVTPTTISKALPPFAHINPPKTALSLASH